MAEAVAHAEGQQHPIKLYLVVWGWLFVLSACSYLVDYFHVQGYLRWFLILLFMMLKAGLIVAVFMHMAWERLALSLRDPAPAGAGAGVRRDHGVRVGLHPAHQGALLRRGALSFRRGARACGVLGHAGDGTRARPIGGGSQEARGRGAVR